MKRQMARSVISLSSHLVSADDQEGHHFHLAGGGRFKREKMEPEDQPVSIFVHRNEAGVGIDNNSIIRILWECKNGQRGWVKNDKGRAGGGCLLPLHNVWPWNSRRLLCVTAVGAALPNNTAASTTSSLHTTAAVPFLALPHSSPPPLPTLLPW